MQQSLYIYVLHICPYTPRQNVHLVPLWVFCLVSTNSPAMIPQVMGNIIRHKSNFPTPYTNIMYPSLLHRLRFLSHNFENATFHQVTNSLLGTHLDVPHPTTSPLKVQHALMVPQCFQPVDLFQTNAPQNANLAKTSKGHAFMERLRPTSAHIRHTAHFFSKIFLKNRKEDYQLAVTDLRNATSSFGGMVLKFLN